MTDSDPERASPFGRMLRRQDFYVGLGTVLLGTLGLLDIAYGDWSEGPAIGPHAFPQIAYIALIAAGLGVLADVALGGGDPPIDNMRTVLTTGLAVTGGGVAMFWLANVLGFAVAVGVTLMIASFLLIPEPLKRWKTTLVVPVIATAVMYLLFINLVSVPLSRGLLF